MADTIKTIVAASDRPDPYNDDDFSVAYTHGNLLSALSGVGGWIDTIPYNPAARDSGYLYVGKAVQMPGPAPSNDYIQVDAGFTLFNLQSIPANKIIKRVRLLCWLHHGTSAEFVYNPDGSVSRPAIPWANSQLAMGVVNFDWGRDYPYPFNNPWPDVGIATTRTGLYERTRVGGVNWFTAVLGTSVDSDLTPANCGAKLFEYLNLDIAQLPTSWRYYLPLEVKPSEYPSEWGPGANYYRVAIMFDPEPFKTKPYGINAWMAMGSANNGTGVQRMWIEVTYGDLAGSITQDMHAYLEAIAPPPAVKRLAPATVGTMHGYFNASATIKRNVLWTGDAHAQFTIIPTVSRYATATADLHAMFIARQVNEQLITADMHGFFGVVDTRIRNVSATQDMHGLFQITTPDAPNVLLITMRNFSTSKLVALLDDTTKVTLIGTIPMNIEFDGEFSSMKVALTAEHPIAMRMDFAGDLLIGKTVTVGGTVVASVEGTLIIRGDA